MYMELKITLIKIQVGNPTNGATTGSHLHFTIKEHSKAVDPLYYYTLSD